MAEETESLVYHELREWSVHGESDDQAKRSGSKKSKTGGQYIKPNGKLNHETVKSLWNGDTEEVCQWVSSLPQEERTELINQHTDTEGRKALHIACLHNQLEVAKILLEAGADPNIEDHYQRTALHCACSNQYVHKELMIELLKRGCDLDAKDKEGSTVLHYSSKQTHHSDVVKLLLEKRAKLEVRDHFGLTPVHWATRDVEMLQVFLRHSRECVHYTNHFLSTPLHYAAEKGHSAAVTLLLKNGADMTARDKDGLAPIHWATGDVKILEEMINHSPDCVKWTGENENKETPLHFAAYYSHTEGAEKLLQCSNTGLVHVTNDHNVGKQTPLHYAAAYSKDPRLAEVLLNHGADAKALDWRNRDPLYIACQYGNAGVVNVLLERGVKVEVHYLEVAIMYGNQRVAEVLLKYSHWPKLLRQTYTLDDCTETTPFREMIKTMPDIAEDILNRCIIVNPKNKDPRNKNYEVVFNYEFIEDFRDREESEEHSDDTDAMEVSHLEIGTFEGMDALDRKYVSEEKKFGITFAEVKHRQNNSVSWGPVGFSMSNHPLAIMAKGTPKLLTHPLVRSALHHKWKMFGQYAYYTNLFTYFLFLIFLTTFALLVPNPQTDECASQGLNNTTAGKPVECRSSKSVQAGVYISAGIVILSAFCRILLEALQLIIYKLDYLTDWVNWLELVMYVSSIIFVWVFNTQCQCPYNWQWQIGAVAIFLGWFNLVLFSSKFPPFGGIYVLMFVKIIKTFLKICILSFLLVLAFALTFYMAFYEPSISRSPFSHPGRSILKTMSMTAGDFDFDSIFRQDPTGGGDTLDEIPFPPISYIMWIVFIVLMPVLLTNMLVGLAVGDIQEILEEAAETKIALQIEQVLTTEDLLRKCVKLGIRICSVFMCCNGHCKCEWSTKTRYSIFPNKSFNFIKERLKKIQFSLWGGDPYYTHDALKHALQSQDQNGQRNHEHDFTDLKRQMKMMENTMAQRFAKLQETINDLVNQSATD